MMKLRSLLMLSLCLGLLLSPLVVRCEEDETDEGVVEEEGVAGEESEEEGAENPLKNVSPDAETTILFTNPTIRTSVAELPAGRLVEFFGWIHEQGRLRFDGGELGCFFPLPHGKTVKPKTEATVAYSFIPADAFAGRPIGLTINLAYLFSNPRRRKRNLQQQDPLKQAHPMTMSTTSGYQSLRYAPLNQLRRVHVRESLTKVLAPIRTKAILGGQFHQVESVHHRTTRYNAKFICSVRSCLNSK
ncbi:SSR1 [Lepeophtheirus salmonis]|uniref:SSR1 n=1 Tax=Lepeophtheirus salmonis TaxID=72036 RepID=A0A7R8H8Q1_LEPSM|nr:SSR1 [Lepeophtheirus salmonis]CAF2943579.1 SSR1 [Lepeophtheirus salmonis]